MKEENFSEWNITDLLFESKLDKTLNDPVRKVKIDLEIKRRYKASDARNKKYLLQKEQKFKQFRTGYQLWGIAFLVSEILLFSIMAIKSPSGQLGIFLSLTLIACILIIFGCMLFCVFDAINRRRWSAFIGIWFVGFITVPYYLLVTTRYD